METFGASKFATLPARNRAEYTHVEGGSCLRL